jgi:hypothetical protein
MSTLWSTIVNNATDIKVSAWAIRLFLQFYNICLIIQRDLCDFMAIFSQKNREYGNSGRKKSENFTRDLSRVLVHLSSNDIEYAFQ